MLVSGALAGAILGLVVGRDWRRLGQLRVKFLPLLLSAFAMRGLAPLFTTLALPLYVLSIAATGLVAGANRQLPGMILIAAGSASNLIVVLANGGMPVDLDALAAVGGTMPHDDLHIPLTDAATLAALADVLPVPFVRGAYSLGDVFIAAGAFFLSFITLARR